MPDLSLSSVNLAKLCSLADRHFEAELIELQIPTVFPAGFGLAYQGYALDQHTFDGTVWTVGLLQVKDVTPDVQGFADPKVVVLQPHDDLVASQVLTGYEAFECFEVNVHHLAGRVVEILERILRLDKVDRRFITAQANFNQELVRYADLLKFHTKPLIYNVNHMSA